MNLRLYRLVLFSYPREFRLRFAPEMLEAFANQLGEGSFEAWKCVLREIVTIALPMQLRNAIVVASAVSLVAASAVYLALLWALTRTVHLPR